MLIGTNIYEGCAKMNPSEDAQKLIPGIYWETDFSKVNIKKCLLRK